jgi:hypothetical protein
MSADPLDFSGTLAAKSDQLNASDITGGPITVQITGAKVNALDDQPLSFRLSGGHMPWKPCKGMRRLLAEAAGSYSAAPWVGKWISLFRDPNVKWAGAAAGGIRVSGIDASILQRPKSFRVRDGRNSHTAYKVEPISDRQQGGAPTADLSALLTDAGLFIEDLDMWLVSEGKPPSSEGTDASRAKLAGWLAGDPARLQRIRDLAASKREPGTDEWDGNGGMGDRE